MTFPRKAEGSFFKEPHSPSVARARKRMKADAGERSQKAEVRKRDKRCRFPLCGCRKMHLGLAVAHLRHKGMGGNPTGDRSQAPLMILLCHARHRENAVALDRGTLHIECLTDRGTDGPVAWSVDGRYFPGAHLTPGTFIEVAREAQPNVWEPFTPTQRTILVALAELWL